MSWPGAGVIVFMVLLGMLLLYDLIALAIGGYKATVSAQMLRFSMKFPVIALIVGFFLGHLFWPNLGACLP